MNQIKIGEFLKELRKEKGLTQEQLAEQFNVSRRSVSRWETGNNMPDLSMLITLAEYYEVDVKEIIAYSSVAHAVVYVLGVFSNTIQGIEGAIILGLAHG